MKRQDLVFILSPFLLTSILIVLGYQILIGNTPEGRLTLPPESTNIEILQDGNVKVVTPTTELPLELSMAIHPIPNNTPQLDQLMTLSTQAGATGIYFTLPVTVNSDNTLELTDADKSSEENIIRWAKRSISLAHQNGLHVTLAVTLNATSTINDYQTFSQSLNTLIPKWASLATEYGVSFFSPGITLGHPLYSELTSVQVSQLLSSTQRSIRQEYNGRIGVGLCCQLETNINPGGYNFITIIPTPEITFDDLQLPATNLAAIQNMLHLFHYDRIGQRVITMPRL